MRERIITDNPLSPTLFVGKRVRVRGESKEQKKPLIHFTTFSGFTLLEILIALFIFAIVSSLIAVALRTVINAQSETEAQSTRFRNLEMAWVIFANDIQQTANRPILDASGRQEAAFIGLQASMTFTHSGWPNPRGELLRSTLQRTRYRLQDHTVFREIWPELDRGQATSPLARPLLQDVAMLRFEYLDERRQFHAMWPVSQQPTLSPLPRAVRIIVIWVDGKKMSQLYVIPH